MRRPLLEVKDLQISIAGARAEAAVVRGLSFSISRGETLSIVGESGAGKTLTGLSIMRLLPRGARIVSGSILLDGIDLAHAPEERMESVRGNRIAMIFQDPLSSLHPAYRIGAQIGEAIRAHRMGVTSVGREVERLLRLAEMAKETAQAYPHQLSGGMLQRASIAMALAASPDLLIADEPTTALDVTIQAQIVDLLGRLKEQSGMSVLLITHDLGVVASLADAVLVIREGRMVESGGAQEILSEPREKYTRELVAAIPGLEVV